MLKFGENLLVKETLLRVTSPPLASLARRLLIGRRVDRVYLKVLRGRRTCFCLSKAIIVHNNPYQYEKKSMTIKIDMHIIWNMRS
jgi:hypothetical protein